MVEMYTILQDCHPWECSIARAGCGAHPWECSTARAGCGGHPWECSTARAGCGAHLWEHCGLQDVLAGLLDCRVPHSEGADCKVFKKDFVLTIEWVTATISRAGFMFRYAFENYIILSKAKLFNPNNLPEVTRCLWARVEHTQGWLSPPLHQPASPPEQHH